MRWPTVELLGDRDAESNAVEAEERCRHLLEEDPTHNATTQMVEVKFAELLIRNAAPESLPEAWALLETWRTDRLSSFPANHFAWTSPGARWGEEADRMEVSREPARMALDWVEAEAPFSPHPGVGVVRTDKNMLKWLPQCSSPGAVDIGVTATPPQAFGWHPS